MVPTFKFRWYSKVYHVTTSMILEERNRTDDPMFTCKKRLEARTQPVLQQWNACESNDDEAIIAAGGAWKDIECFTEIVGHPQAIAQAES